MPFLFRLHLESFHIKEHRKETPVTDYLQQVRGQPLDYFILKCYIHDAVETTLNCFVLNRMKSSAQKSVWKTFTWTLHGDAHHSLLEQLSYSLRIFYHQELDEGNNIVELLQCKLIWFVKGTPWVLMALQ